MPTQHPVRLGFSCMRLAKELTALMSYTYVILFEWPPACHHKCCVSPWPMVCFQSSLFSRPLRVHHIGTSKRLYWDRNCTADAPHEVTPACRLIMFAPSRAPRHIRAAPLKSSATVVRPHRVLTGPRGDSGEALPEFVSGARTAAWMETPGSPRRFRKPLMPDIDEDRASRPVPAEPA
jgi:hypothetical protein